jgi:hypothetical protein
VAENPVLRRRMAEIGAKLADARIQRDQLHASAASTGKDERLEVIDREMAILELRMKALLAELVAD